MSRDASKRHQRTLFNQLPRELRDELISLGRRAKNMFGRVNFQSVFDKNLQLFDRLADNGATALDIGELLAAAGIKRKDGTALPEGTVSAGLSRARERAGCRAIPRQPADRCTLMQGPASACNALHDAQESGSSGGLPQRPPVQHPPAQPPGLSSVRIEPNGPTGFVLPAHARRAAALLDQIRSENDEGNI